MNTASPIPLLILIVLAAAWVTWLIVQPRMTGWRRERLRRNPFPQDWERIMRRWVPLVRRMPEDLQTQLKGHIQVFLAEKAFIGCEGQAITDNAGTFSDVWGNDAILAYVTPKSLQEMGSQNYGYTYQLAGRPIVEEGYLDRGKNSFMYPVSDASQVVLTSADSGYLIKNAVN